MSEILDVVNENDEVIGQAERKEVHDKGLICRMVYVCFRTPAGELILQRRSKTKKSNPGRLTTTVSGHVEAGANYDETAIKETYEETGVHINKEKLQQVDVIYKSYTEGSYLSNAMRALYVYEFDGDPNELVIEEGEGVGFETLSVSQLQKQLRDQSEDFVPFLRECVEEGLLV